MIKSKLWKKKKETKKSITMLTCYDYWSAKILDQSNIDAVLVGDSVANICAGFEHTTFCSVDMMAYHISCVARGIKTKAIVGDVPFLEAQTSRDEFLKMAKCLVNAGAHALKIEGSSQIINENIKLIVDSGIPVMGHLGLTPQSVLGMGGYKVQGKNIEASDKIFEEALLLQKAGAFSLVLECVPTNLANKITDELNIPTIGIGAGSGTDGQILVLHDMLGLQTDLNPKFVRKFKNLSEQVTEGVNEYVSACQTMEFPSKEESY